MVPGAPSVRAIPLAAINNVVLRLKSIFMMASILWVCGPTLRRRASSDHSRHLTSGLHGGDGLLEIIATPTEGEGVNLTGPIRPKTSKGAGTRTCVSDRLHFGCGFEEPIWNRMQAFGLTPNIRPLIKESHMQAQEMIA